MRVFPESWLQSDEPALRSEARAVLHRCPATNPPKSTEPSLEDLSIPIALALVNGSVDLGRYSLAQDVEPVFDSDGNPYDFTEIE